MSQQFPVEFWLLSQIIIAFNLGRMGLLGTAPRGLSVTFLEWAADVSGRVAGVSMEWDRSCRTRPVRGQGEVNSSHLLTE